MSVDNSSTTSVVKLASNRITVEVWPVVRFIPYSRNLRKSDHAIERMVASIIEFGFKIPMLARSSGEVVDGHLRLKAAEKLGLQELPVILCDEWSDAGVKAFRLLANRSVSWAEWDEDLVALEIGELKELDFDLSLTGFDPVEIDGFLFGEENDDVPDSVSDLPQQATSRLGDLWICGEHRVLCGDATSAEAVGNLLGYAQPVLMVTDPP